MNRKTASTPRPHRVSLHAYERLSRLCAEIQRERYPTKAMLARLVERRPRTVQNDLQALVNDFAAPLEFDHSKNGWYFTDESFFVPICCEAWNNLEDSVIRQRSTHQLLEYRAIPSGQHCQVYGSHCLA
jgi:hypothetical protein